MDDEYLKTLIRLVSRVPSTREEAMEKLKRLDSLVGNGPDKGHK